MKKILSIMLGICMLSLASAISISPKNIELGSVYPNEIIPYNITIISNENATIFFNSNNPYIKITPESVNVTEDTNITLNFSIAGDITSGDIKFKIIGCKEGSCEEPITTPSSSGNYGSNSGSSDHHSGSGASVTNKTKPINITLNGGGGIKINQSDNTNKDICISGECKKPKEISKIYVKIIILLAILISVFLAYRNTKKTTKQEIDKLCNDLENEKGGAECQK